MRCEIFVMMLSLVSDISKVKEFFVHSKNRYSTSKVHCWVWEMTFMSSFFFP